MAASPGRDARNNRRRALGRNTLVGQRNSAAARAGYDAGVDRTNTPTPTPSAAANALMTRNQPPPQTAPPAQLSAYIPMQMPAQGPNLVTDYANTVTAQIQAQQLQSAMNPATVTAVGVPTGKSGGGGGGGGGSFAMSKDWGSPGTPDAEAFATAVLRGLPKGGAPVNANNLALMQAWFRAEGTSAKWNPLGSTEPMGGQGAINSDGVQNYRSLADGVAATIKTLTNGRYNDIVKLMLLGINPIKLFRQAEDEFDVWRGSASGKGHYGLIQNLKEMRRG